MESINQKQDSERESKLTREKEKEKYLEKKNQEKELRRSKRVATRQRVLENVEKKVKATKGEASANQKKRKSVSFESETKAKVAKK